MLNARRWSNGSSQRKLWPPRRLGAALVAVVALAAAFGVGTRLGPSVSRAAVADSCSYADHNMNSTTVYVDTHLYSCHPSTGSPLPTGSPIGWVYAGSQPTIYGHWWNTVSVDGDGSGGTCQPSTKWLTGSAGNWYSATCTAAP